MLSAMAQPAARAPARGAPMAFACLCALVLALQFGPTLGLLGFGLTGDERFTLNGIARDLAVMALLVLGAAAAGSAGSAAAGRQLPPSGRWAIVLVVVYGLLALRGSGGPLLVGLNLRRLVLVPMLFVALLLIPWSRTQVERVFKLVVWTSIAVALLGLLERLAPTSLWTDVLGIEAFNAANPFDPWGLLPFGESGRFFSWDLEAWTGQVLRRMVSTYLEPTTLAAAMALLLALGAARLARGTGGAGLVLLGLVCGLATISKGFALYLLALCSWRLLGVPSPRHLLAVVGVDLDGPLAHVSGLASGLSYLLDGNLLGEGIGAAGNYTTSDADFGEESGLGNNVAQVGLAGLLPLLWVAAMARDLLRAAAARSDRGGIWLASWLLFWTLTYLFSASSLGVGGNALGFALLALYLHPAAGPRGS
jgi:hypothetical protein